MKTLIFSNGELLQDVWVKNIIKDAGLVIAADGGARHASGLGLEVMHLIGDMDSVDLATFQKLKDTKCKISVFPEDKDKTDLELAMDLALAHGASEIHILGAEGGRFDHMLGNALIGAKESFSNIPVWYYSSMQRSTAVFPCKNRKFKTLNDKLISVIPLCQKAEGFSISGVNWPLSNVTLELGSTYSISNRSSAEEVEVSFNSGVVLLVFEDLL